MKTIGLLGGMSWESTVTYYQIINTVVRERLGGLHSAKCVLYSVDFDEIEACQSSGDWARSAEILSAAARALERAGADFIVLCTNTMHKVAPEISARCGVPVLHIAEVTARALKARGVETAALLGTRYTMEQDWYQKVLTDAGVRVLIPGEADRVLVNDVIFRELCLGVVSPASRAKFLRIIDSLGAAGAQGVILGCTEIGLLVGQENTTVPLFDTTLLHARQAALDAISQ